jgi:HPt (histidine-containing phosphotransfer) domain-containing protein
MDFRVLPDKKLEELLEKYTEKSNRYKHFVNEETDRAEQKVTEINEELKYREEQRKLLYTFIN